MDLPLPELLLPAGNPAKLRMALAYGADAVYVGAAGFSMRPDGSAFDLEGLADAVASTRALGKQIYVAVNNLMFDADLGPYREWLEATREIPMSALILSDVGALALTRELRPEVELHISTQMSTANAESVRFWGQIGASRVVLARECTLADARHIAAATGVDLEVFVHGAMCMAVSGRCLISAQASGRSANQGQCAQSCRWDWQLVEKMRPGEAFPIFETERETFLMGSTDLCLIEHIPELIQSGVHSLKVEGRMKSVYYAATIARTYRAALDAYAADPEGYATDPQWVEELLAVSHRPYDTGFAFGYSKDQSNRLQAPNKPVSTHEVLGFVQSVDGREILLEAKNRFGVGDEVEWIGPGMTGGTLTVEALHDDAGKPMEKCISGRKTLARIESPDTLPPHAILRRALQ